MPVSLHGASLEALDANVSTSGICTFCTMLRQLSILGNLGQVLGNSRAAKTRSIHPPDTHPRIVAQDAIQTAQGAP